MNLIFCAYAAKQGFQAGHNISKANTEDIYLKNTYVALYSAKQYNPTDDVALITNVDLSKEWQNLFQNAGIKVFKKEYNEFLFPPDYPWSLAFYKLCAVKFVLTLDYDKCVLIDTDTYIQRNFNNIWAECDNHILLYDYSRGLYNGDYAGFCKEISQFVGCTTYPTHWGGEFIGGSKSLLKEFIGICESIYSKMNESRFITKNGDEFITSIAAIHMKHLVKNAKGYIFRYWTSYGWYYSCSNYNHNPVTVLHCPAEKAKGFLRIYKYIYIRKKLPKINKVYRMLHLDIHSAFWRNSLMTLLYTLKVKR